MVELPHGYVPDLMDLELLERRYEFLRELGRGGMAAVHLARRRDTGELVALKAICRRYADDTESRARFAREARTVVTFDHPNIVRTLDVERVDDRIVAIVMEYLHGRTLREALRHQRRLSFDRATEILRDVAIALAHAHERGVVHRDVKPDNIFLDDDAGRARLADFGIARALDNDVELTLAGMALGTPAYMSPEQIDGDPLDGRSDIYSLGVVGWEMLAGERPWDGESLYGMIYRQKHDELADLARIRPDVPFALLGAIEGALRKSPAARWATARDFLDALDGVASEPRQERLPSRATAAANEFATLKFRRISRPGEVLEPPQTVAARSEPSPEPTLAVESEWPDAPVDFDDPPLEPEWPPSWYDPDRPALSLEPLIDGTPPWRLPHPHEPVEPEPVIPRRPMMLAMLVLVATLGVGAVNRAPGGDAGRFVATTSTLSLDELGVPATAGLTSRSERSAIPPAFARTRRDSLAACSRMTPAHQQLCANMLTASADANVSRVFDEYLSALHAPGGSATVRDPARRDRVLQRAWQIERDIECADRVPERPGERWGIARGECVAAITGERVEELRAALARLRGGTTQ